MLERLTLEMAGTLVGGLLTLMVLSYLVGDNPLFRLATHIFIGVAAGYAGAIAWHKVLLPGLVQPLLDQGVSGFLNLDLLVPAVLILLLLLKISPGTARFGSLPLALLVGVGAGVVVGGAIQGTLIPQVQAAMESLSPATEISAVGEGGLERVGNVLILIGGTLSTLLYFRFTAAGGKEGEPARSKVGEIVAGVGKIFIALTFGALYAGALMAAIVAFVERAQFLWDLALALLSA